MQINVSISQEELEYAENTAKMLMDEGVPEYEAIEKAIEGIKVVVDEKTDLHCRAD